MKRAEALPARSPGLLEQLTLFFVLLRLLNQDYLIFIGEIFSMKAEPRSIPNFHDSDCRPDSLCVACALVLVAQHRFIAFQEKFGRWPGPDEELFFDGTRPVPVRARPDQIKRQILDAAEMHNLQVAPLLSFFGIQSDLD